MEPQSDCSTIENSLRNKLLAGELCSPEEVALASAAADARRRAMAEARAALETDKPDVVAGVGVAESIGMAAISRAKKSSVALKRGKDEAMRVALRASVERRTKAMAVKRWERRDNENDPKFKMQMRQLEQELQDSLQG